MRLSLLPCLFLSLITGCDDTPPAWCASEGELSFPCRGARCLAAVMVDYKRLEPRGYLIRRLFGSDPVDAREAEAIAVEHVTFTIGAETPGFVDSDKAGDFYNCFLTYQNNDSWLVIIHRHTGDVVFAGFEACATSERGMDYPLPPGWMAPGPLGCTDGAGEPASRALRTTGMPLVQAPASTAAEAMAVAQRLNLTERFAAGERFHMMVVSYAPATCEFDIKSSDWLVWITRDQPGSD